MSAKLLSFDDLWAKANKADRSSNGLSYHSCCDIWTSRGAEAKRATHRNRIQWRKLISILDKTIVDKKQALHGKMTEEGWRIPSVMNESCRSQLRHNLDQLMPFRLYNPEHNQRELVPDLTPQDSVHHIPHGSSYEDRSTF